jgi:O-antigen/teichoic acid export membrane protein
MVNKSHNLHQTAKSHLSSFAPLSLRQNFSWTFAGNLVYAASQWGLLVVFAKFGTPEMIGQFALALAMTTPIILFANLSLRAVQATDARQEYQFGDYLGLRLLTILLAGFIIIGIIFLSDYGQETKLVILFIGLSKSFEAISDIIFGLLQQQERMDRIAKSLMIEGTVTLAVVTIIIWLTHSIVLGVAGLAIVWGLQLILYDLPSAALIIRARYPDKNIWSLLRPRLNFRITRGLVWLALPLAFVAGLGSLSVQLPRLALERFEGQYELGIFAAIASVGTIFTMITIALSGSALPRLAQLFVLEQYEHFGKLVMRLVGIGTIIGVIGIIGSLIWGRVFLSIVYTEEYAIFTDVFIVIVINAGVTAALNFFGTALSATQQFTVQVPIHILKFLVVGISLYLLIPYWGILGAACAVLAGSLVSGCAYGFILWRTLHRSQRKL